MVEKFKGLYYPYARCLDEDTLKKALLIFDQLYFIDPLLHIEEEKAKDIDRKRNNFGTLHY